MMAADQSLLKRCAIAAVALALYGSGASWIVHREAQSYRDSVKPVAEIELKDSPPREIAPEPHPPSKTNVVEAPTVKLSEPKTVVSVAPLAPVVIKESKPVARSLEDEKNEKAAAEIWDNPAVKKVYDLDNYTADDDRELGATLNELICKLSHVAPEGPEGARVTNAGEALRQKLTRKQVTYTILDSDEYNIFSHPGGHIYITNGMLLRIGNDEEYVLQFALAHEMAHLELGHMLQCLQLKPVKDVMTAAKKGTAETICQLVLPVAYPDVMEFEADRWALQRMKELGHDEYESLRYLVKLEKLANAKNFGQGHVTPRPSPERTMLDNHVRAHVRVKDRLDRAEAFWNGKPTPAPK